MSFKIGMLTEACQRHKLVYDQKRAESGIAALAHVFFDKKTGQYSLLYLDGSTTLLIRNSSNQLEPAEMVQEDSVPSREFFEKWRRVTFGDIMFGEELLPHSLREIIMEKKNSAFA